MKEIRTEDAVGHILCHDITQIIKDEKKGVLFKKGHVVKEEDIPLLLSVGKEHLFVWEKKTGILHENEAAEILYKICAGNSSKVHGTEIKEGKIEVVSKIDGILKIRRDALVAVNSLGEMMIAARSISAVKGLAGKGSSGGHSSSGSTSAMQGGLAGIVSRKFTGSAVKRATGSSSGGLGGMAFRSSVSKGGDFANKVIGSIATGSIASNGSISGANASDALTSYMGYTALGESTPDAPKFSNAEIGGGHIFATETSEEYPNGIAIGMYHTTQYMLPDGEYTTVAAADGTLWYKQYATDTVERKPYHTEDGSVAYHETIVKKLPSPPRRKDKV